MDGGTAVRVVIGRDRERQEVGRLLDADGPGVCFVHGLAGIGKSTLLSAFRADAAAAGVATWYVDCATLDPTEAAFVEALAAAGWSADAVGVVVVDTYELFRIADPWLRRDFLRSLAPGVRLLLASRDAPMLEWAVEGGLVGGLEVVPLGPLSSADASALLRAAGVDQARARTIEALAAGHPLAMRLAVEAELSAFTPAEASVRVLDALAEAFRAGLDAADRELLDVAAVPRRVTADVLRAMLGPDADVDASLRRLRDLSFVDVTEEGLRLHDAVHAAIAARLRALDPATFRRLRTAAWRHLHAESQRSGASELRRSTADLLFLIDNPVVREAMFPTSAHDFSVEPSRPEDHDDLRALWHAHDGPDGAAALDAWLRLRPQAVRAVRDRRDDVVGCSIVAEWRDIPPSLERQDPVVAAWSRHLAKNPLPPRHRTLTHRRVLARDGGEGPSGPQAAAWLDLKRDYLRLRPHLGRLYTGIRDPSPFLDALLTLQFRPFDEPIALDGAPFHLASLDFGPESIDGWLRRLAAAELGIDDAPFLDPSDRTADVAGTRVALSPLEYGVLDALASRAGTPASRADLLAEVWGTSYDGGSNTVDVVVRNLRKKLGVAADRIETVRGIGYRLR